MTGAFRMLTSLPVTVAGASYQSTNWSWLTMWAAALLNPISLRACMIPTFWMAATFAPTMLRATVYSTRYIVSPVPPKTSLSFPLSRTGDHFA